MGTLTFCCSLGLSSAVLLHCTSLVHPLLLQFTGPAGVDNRTPLRRVDPTCRLRGWRYLGQEVDRLKHDCEAHGEDPVVAGANWSLPGELGVYCEGHPQAYSLGNLLQDRFSQYDFWTNPGASPELFKNKTFIAVNVFEKDMVYLRTAFEQIDPPTKIEYVENGQTLSIWSVVICRGYKGGKIQDIRGH